MTNVREALAWLSYSYLHVRMARNPLAYGLSWNDLLADPTLEGARLKHITAAAKACAGRAGSQELSWRRR